MNRSIFFIILGLAGWVAGDGYRRNDFNDLATGTAIVMLTLNTWAPQRLTNDPLPECP